VGGITPEMTTVSFNQGVKLLDSQNLIVNAGFKESDSEISPQKLFA